MAGSSLFDFDRRANVDSAVPGTQREWQRLGRSIRFSTTSFPDNSLTYRSVLGAALLVMAGLVLLFGGQQTAASQTRPAVQVVGSDVTPTPRPPRPEINPVSRDDDNVVRPDATSDDEVNDLPASGIGFANPADENIQRWTTLVIAALALNAVILFGVAARSLRRRRV